MDDGGGVSIELRSRACLFVTEASIMQGMCDGARALVKALNEDARDGSGGFL